MADILENHSPATNGALPYSIPLELCVEDRDTMRALLRYDEGQDRDQFALEALKIGVLALRHAEGALDTEFIQRETNRLVENLQKEFEQHSRQTHERLTGLFDNWFDPESGRFNQRVRRLTDEDGELSQLLKPLLDGDDSRLAKTLVSHVGENSPLMKHLSPDQSQGLLALLRKNVEEQLQQQRERLLREFSLDNPESALCRLVSEITSKHGAFTKDMQVKIDEVVKEFSLDEENSALSRLVGNVDQAQRKITQEFSLDNKQSALHKLKEELTTILSAHVKTNNEFQEEVKVALGKLITKRETEARSTLHGGTFQDAVYEFVSRDGQPRGEIVDDTGNTTGLIKNCKVGDAVVEMGEECVAAGARIVIEAKEDSSYSIARARSELETARKNRSAEIGVFVFSERTAPAGIEQLARYGSDILVVWDAEEPQTDCYLKAALEIARALCVRTQQAAAEQVDFTELDRAILDIEKRVGNLDKIRKSAETIKSSSEAILNRVRVDQEALKQQLDTLRQSLGDIKQSLGDLAESPGG